MNITKITQAMTNLVNWVKAGLAKKADKDYVTGIYDTLEARKLNHPYVTVGTVNSVPDPALGIDGEVALIIDA